MNNQKSDFSDEMFYKIQKIEVSIRGRYMRVSAQIEGLLVKNLILLHEEKCIKYKSTIPLKLKGVMFDQKIQMLQSYLKKEHKNLASQYEKLFDHLIAFKKVRNNMAHSYFTWNKNDLTYVIIWELQLDAEPHFYNDVKYTFIELNQTFKEVVSPIMDDLNNLTYDLSDRLKHILPYMFEEEG